MSVESVTYTPRPAAVVVQYNNCALVPAPFVQMTVEPQFADDGLRQSNLTRIVLTGSIVILPSGSYEQLYTKQQEILSAFSEDFKDFVILAGDDNKTLGEGSIICSGLQPKVISVDFPADIQVNRFDYTIELEDSVTASGVSGVVSSFSNQWSFSENQDSCVLDVTHTVTAEGVDGDPDAFLQAQRRVKANLGISNLPLELPCFVEPNASGNFGFTHPQNPAGGPIFEVSVRREETADIANGSYSVTEVFTIVSGVPFYFTQRNDSYSEDQNGVSTVTIQGTVQGLGRTLDPSFGADGGRGFDRACSGFLYHVKPNLPSDASGVYAKYKSVVSTSGLQVNNPTSFTVAQNKCRGTIDFSVTYTDDISLSLPSGIVDATVNIQRTDGIRQYASHPIPLRRLGPLIQDIKTTTEGSISITASARAANTGNPADDTNRAIEYVESELNRLRALHAQAANFITLRVSGLDQGHSDRDLTAQASLNYIFTVDLANTIDENSPINLQRI